MKPKLGKSALRANIAMSLSGAIEYLNRAEETDNDIYHEFAMAAVLAGMSRLKELNSRKKLTKTKRTSKRTPKLKMFQYKSLSH